MIDNLPQTVLVTGGAGFIGSNLVDVLLSKGHRVVAYDNFSTGQREFLEGASESPSFRLVEADLLDESALREAIRGCGFVFHLAANADIRSGLANPRRDVEQNTLATLNVLEAMRAEGIRPIAFASSAAALGEPEVFPTPEDCATPVQTSLYGASKMACEGLISSYCEGFGFEGYVFRFVSLLGPRYPHGHVFDFYKLLLDDPTRLTVLGDGNQRKSYLHIQDCLEAMLHVIQLETAKSAKHRIEIYNLGNTEYCRVDDSVGWICDQLNVTPAIEHTGGERGWVGDSPFVFLDNSKMRRTGWEVRHGIEESIRATVDWLTANRWILDRRS